MHRSRTFNHVASMIFRIAFALVLLFLIVPHEPDLGLGKSSLLPHDLHRLFLSRMEQVREEINASRIAAANEKSGSRN